MFIRDRSHWKLIRSMYWFCRNLPRLSTSHVLSSEKTNSYINQSFWHVYAWLDISSLKQSFDTFVSHAANTAICKYTIVSVGNREKFFVSKWQYSSNPNFLSLKQTSVDRPAGRNPIYFQMKIDFSLASLYVSVTLSISRTLRLPAALDSEGATTRI